MMSDDTQMWVAAFEVCRATWFLSSKQADEGAHRLLKGWSHVWREVMGEVSGVGGEAGGGGGGGGAIRSG